MGIAKWKATSDFKDLERDFDKLNKENAKLIAQNQKLANESEKAKRKAKGVFQMNVRGAAQAAIGIAGITSAWGLARSAVGLYTSALRDKRRAEQEAAQTQREIAAQQEDQLDNIITLSKKEKDFLRQRAGIIQKKAAFPDFGKIESALGIGISSGATPQRASEATMIAAELSRNRPEMIGAFTKAFVDLQNKTGAKTILGAAGFTASTQQQGFVSTIGKVAKNLPRVVASMAASVPKQDKQEVGRFAGAFFARLSKRGSDSEGEVTRSAGLAMSKALTKFVTTGFKMDELTLNRMAEKGITPAGMKDGVVRPEDPGTMQGRFKLLQDPGLREAFFSKAGLGQAETFIRILTTKAGEKEIEATRKLISFDESLARKRITQGRTATTSLRTGTREASTDAILQTIDRKDEIGAIRASSRRLAKGASEKLRARGFGAISDVIDERLTKLSRRAGADTTKDLSQLFIRRINRIRTEQDPQQFLTTEADIGSAGMPQGRIKSDKELTNGEKQTIDLLRDVVRQLQSNRAEEAAEAKRLAGAQQNVNKSNANAARGKQTENR